MFSNTLKDESVNEFFLFWKAGVLNCYITLLQTTEDTATILKGVYHMLRIAREVALSEENMVLAELEKAGVFEIFNKLQRSYDQEIYENVTKILKEFLPLIEIQPKRERPADEEYDDEENYE